MKQQQLFEKLSLSRVNYYCRYCDVDVKKRDNLLRNTVMHDRYYYQIIDI